MMAFAVWQGAVTVLAVSAALRVGVGGGRPRQKRGSGRWQKRPMALAVIGEAGEGVGGVGGSGDGVGGRLGMTVAGQRSSRGRGRGSGNLRGRLTALAVIGEAGNGVGGV